MLRRLSVVAATIALAQVGWVSGTQAQIIDFETTPSGATSVDNATLGLGDGYTIGGFTITFGFDTNLDDIPETETVFELRGGADPSIGFVNCCLGTNDDADVGLEAQLGDFFLRQASFGIPFGRLVIDYSGLGLVSAASGEIWDIDGQGTGTEQYRVRALDSGGTVLATLDSPAHGDGGCGIALDGEPWKFEFMGLLTGIARITIEFIGTKPNNIGLAFNNFDALGVTVPTEESTWGGIKAVYE